MEFIDTLITLLIIIIIFIIGAIIFAVAEAISFIDDKWDDRTNKSIENNTTLTINDITLTIPQSNNTTINNTDTIDFYTFLHTNYEPLNLDAMDHFTKNNTSQSYQDYNNNITIYTINTSDAGYLNNYEDGETADSVETSEWHYQQKRTINDKIILVKGYGENTKKLTRKIINSATPTQ